MLETTSWSKNRVKCIVMHNWTGFLEDITVELISWDRWEELMR